MTYPVTLSESIDNIIKGMVTYHYLSDPTDREKLEVVHALENIPEFVNPYKHIRGLPPVWSPLDLGYEEDIAFSEVIGNALKVKRTDNALLIQLRIGIPGQNRSDLDTSRISRITDKDIMLKMSIYHVFAITISYWIWSDRAIALYNAYIKNKIYGPDIQQFFYDIMELRYSDYITSDVFGYARNDFQILLDISNRLYGVHSPDHNLGEELDRLHINWRKIPKIWNLEIYPETRTVDYIFKSIREYLSEVYAKKYEIGTRGAKEAVDLAATRAGLFSLECEKLSYENVQAKALALFRSLSKKEKCEILESYVAVEGKPNALIEFEQPCIDYTDEELIDAYNEILDYLPKITLCQFLDEYSQ